MPNETYQASNYWVDVTFAPSSEENISARDSGDDFLISLSFLDSSNETADDLVTDMLTSTVETLVSPVSTILDVFDTGDGGSAYAHDATPVTTSGESANDHRIDFTFDPRDVLLL